MAEPVILPSGVPWAEAPADVIDARLRGQRAERPRRDYDLLACALDASLLFPPRDGRPTSRFEERAAFELRQALAALRRGAPLYISLSERVGLPLALLLRRRRARTPHLLVAHHLTSPRKRLLQRRLRWLDGVASVVVACGEQERYLVGEAGVEAGRVRRVPVGVDLEAWRPASVGGSASGGRVVAVGRERRDYGTLAAAAHRLPHLSFAVVAGSPWARDRGGDVGPVPPNVAVRPGGMSHAEMLRLYGQARTVALPLEPGCRYAAGVNGFLEAMAMNKPVVATHTPGLADYLDGNAAVRTVPTGDADALAAALGAPPLVGAVAGRDVLTERKWTLEAYVAAVAQAAREATV